MIEVGKDYIVDGKRVNCVRKHNKNEITHMLYGKSPNPEFFEIRYLDCEKFNNYVREDSFKDEVVYDVGKRKQRKFDEICINSIYIVKGMIAECIDVDFKRENPFKIWFMQNPYLDDMWINEKDIQNYVYSVDADTGEIIDWYRLNTAISNLEKLVEKINKNEK